MCVCASCVQVWVCERVSECASVRVWSVHILALPPRLSLLLLGFGWLCSPSVDISFPLEMTFIVFLWFRSNTCSLQRRWKMPESMCRRVQMEILSNPTAQREQPLLTLGGVVFSELSLLSVHFFSLQIQFHSILTHSFLQKHLGALTWDLVSSSECLCLGGQSVCPTVSYLSPFLPISPLGLYQMCVYVHVCVTDGWGEE